LAERQFSSATLAIASRSGWQGQTDDGFRLVETKRRSIMKLSTTLLAAAFVAGIVGAASADHKPGHEPPGNANGVYGCDAFKNPGQGLRDARETTGMNPNELAELLGYDSVGDLIDDACGNPV
jgi:hypothetical protein